MSLDPYADLFATTWPRTLPRLGYRPPAPETLSYLHRRVLRATRELDLPELDARQRRLLSLRRGPKLRSRIVACLQQLPRQPATDLWAPAAAPLLRELLDRDEELEALRCEARDLALLAEDSLLVLSTEVGVLTDQALQRAQALPELSPTAQRAVDRWRELRGGAPAPGPRALRGAGEASERARVDDTRWRGPLERCLEVSVALLGVLPQRLRKVRRRLGAPELQPAQREALLERGPHGREAAADLLAGALCEAPTLGRTLGADGAYLRSLLLRQGQLRALRRGALALAERAEGAQLLLGAYARCLYEMLIELLEGRVQNPRLPPSERRRLGAEFAPLLRLARTGDERLPDAGEANLLIA